MSLQLRQVAAVESGDDDVEKAHDTDYAALFDSDDDRQYLSAVSIRYGALPARVSRGPSVAIGPWSNALS
jgi:hypothetical protein